MSSDCTEKTSLYRIIHGIKKFSQYIQMSGTNAYYHPYISEDEEDGNVSDATESSDTTYDSAAHGLDDPRYAIIRAAGPSLTTVNEQLMYQHGGALGSAYEQQPSNTLDNSPLYIDPKKRIQTTLYSFKSSNRDLRAYPTSSDFTLKLPRTYKNVTQIQLVQISFQYFLNTVVDVSAAFSSITTYLSTQGIDISSCISCITNSSSLTSIGVSERRTHPLDPSQPLNHAVSVRAGRYDTELLAQEMDYQMNKTPPFNLITYTEHRNQFRATKNMLHLFNEPGRYFHNTLRDEFIASPTKTTIHNHYFPENNYLNADIPDDTETFVSYYYPVLKEAIVSKYDHHFLDLNGYSFDEVRRRVIGHFEGLNSQFYYGLCSSNVNYLRKLRDNHTFKYNLINQYDWIYDPGMRHFSVRHDSLHPSIISDINGKHREHFQTALHGAGINPSQFTTLTLQHKQTKAVLNDLGRTLHNSLTSVGIPFSVHPVDFLADSANILSTANSSSIPSEYLYESDTVLHDIASGLLTYTSYLPPPPSRPAGGRDFGLITLLTLANESSDVSINPANYTTDYANALSTLNGKSVITEKVGGAYIPGYSGVSVAAIDFVSMYSTFVSYYSTYSGQAAVLSGIHNSNIALTSNYVNKKYSSVLPQHMLNNNAFLNTTGTLGVTFDSRSIILQPSTAFNTSACPECTDNKCCQLINKLLADWYSCIPANYLVNTLGWKLGFSPTIADVIQFFSTTGTSQTTTPFNIYLQLNIEKSLNNMDVATTEDYSITKDTVGENKVVLGKLLTEGSGLSDITQTIVQSPAQFQTPIGKLDNLHFTLLLDDLVPISKIFPFSFGFTEWDAVIQIDEEIATLNRESDLSSIPRVEWAADKRPF